MSTVLADVFSKLQPNEGSSETHSDGATSRGMGALQPNEGSSETIL